MSCVVSGERCIVKSQLMNVIIMVAGFMVMWGGCSMPAPLLLQMFIHRRLCGIVTYADHPNFS